MVSVNKHDAFPDEHLPQPDVRSGYLTVISRVPCARVVLCVAGLEGEDSSIIDPFSFNDSREVVLGF